MKGAINQCMGNSRATAKTSMPHRKPQIPIVVCTVFGKLVCGTCGTIGGARDAEHDDGHRSSNAGATAGEGIKHMSLRIPSEPPSPRPSPFQHNTFEGTASRKKQKSRYNALSVISSVSPNHIVLQRRAQERRGKGSGEARQRLWRGAGEALKRRHSGDALGRL